MNIEALKAQLLANPEKAISQMETYCLAKTIQDSIKEYYPKSHKIYDTANRKDKMIMVPNEEGKPVLSDVVHVARLALPIQKRIVMTAVAFLGTPQVECTPEGEVETNLLEIVKKVLTDNKMEYRFKTIAKITKSEKECAVLWYTEPCDPEYWEGHPIRNNLKYRLRMKILANSKGDKLYPVFDSYGDMVAFGRAYEIKEIDEAGKETKTDHFDIYTADRFYYMVRVDSGLWEINKDVKDSLDLDGKVTRKADGLAGIPNVIGKIPVIYYSQPCTDWEDVQPLIERLETKISNHADTNDYFDSPVLLAIGDGVEGFSEKSESGKAFQLKGEKADMKYLTWDQAPESMKMEINNLIMFINTLTHTPDISFESMKGIGQFSGFAIQMLFTDAHLKAADSEEIFGEGEQRQLNYLKHALSVLDESFKKALKMDMKPKFNYFMPQDMKEQVDILVKAVEGKILSQQSAIKLNPMVSDSDAEEAQIEKETKAAAPPVVPPKPPITDTPPTDPVQP